MSRLFLGIDTSNYTTSVAIAEDGRITANCKLPVKVAEGQRGVRQSDAVFSHVQNLPEAVKMLDLQNRAITAIGYSARPRDVDGSYMPCFLAGKALAESLGAIIGVKTYAFSHQAGHIAAACYSSGEEEKLGDRFLAYHVSGGTTELLLVEKTADNYHIELIGGTDDLTAGQAIDRVGVMLGLRFPCGPALEKLAEGMPIPKTRPCVEGLHCHLSGLENQAAKMQKDGKSDREIACYVLEFIRATLDTLTKNAVVRFPDLPLLFAGGVMSCRRMKDYFGKTYGAAFAEPAFSSDNAAGTALLCQRRYGYEYGRE